MKFIQAANFTKLGRERTIRYIVLHSMESGETDMVAENVAAWFAGPNAPKASAHYCVDRDSAVQCVQDNDVAWHAPGLNSLSIGIEMAGKASQTAAEWADAYSFQMLNMAAALVASLCRKYSIPVRAVGPSGLLMDMPGITTHAAVSEAFKKSDHWDPGPNFPLNKFIDTVRGMSGD